MPTRITVRTNLPEEFGPPDQHLYFESIHEDAAGYDEIDGELHVLGPNGAFRYPKGGWHTITTEEAELMTTEEWERKLVENLYEPPERGTT